MNAKSSKDVTKAIDKLNSWEHYRLVLLVAPHGAGKTTLLREWFESLRNFGNRVSKKTEPTQVIWIDLAPQDNFPEKFLSTLAHPLGAATTVTERLDPKGWPEKRQEEGAGSPAPGCLPAEVYTQFEFGMTVLANELAHRQSELILVLDHYHHILSPEIHMAIARLLDYLPPKVHLVIACREEPPLSLPRLRARRQMVDILPSDLKRS